jgi:hypothetical protein
MRNVGGNLLPKVSYGPFSEKKYTMQGWELSAKSLMVMRLTVPADVFLRLGAWLSR